MADVDFSNAVLDVNYDEPLEFSYLGIYSNNPFDKSGNQITTNSGSSAVSSTPAKLTWLFTGTFTANGTEFYLGAFYGSSTGGTWKVSNISFSVGDTYSFVIDIETSGNT